MPKFEKMKAYPPEESYIGFLCPGCAHRHELPTKGPRGWEFNGNFDVPTLRPSILARTPRGPGRPDRICHSFVTDGKIQFLSDCTHKLAGQTVDLLEIEL